MATSTANKGTANGTTTAKEKKPKKPAIDLLMVRIKRLPLSEKVTLVGKIRESVEEQKALMTQQLELIANL